MLTYTVPYDDGSQSFSQFLPALNRLIEYYHVRRSRVLQQIDDDDAVSHLSQLDRCVLRLLARRSEYLREVDKMHVGLQRRWRADTCPVGQALSEWLESGGNGLNTMELDSLLADPRMHRPLDE